MSDRVHFPDEGVSWRQFGPESNFGTSSDGRCGSLGTILPLSRTDWSWRNGVFGLVPMFVELGSLRGLSRRSVCPDGQMRRRFDDDLSRSEALTFFMLFFHQSFGDAFIRNSRIPCTFTPV